MGPELNFHSGAGGARVQGEKCHENSFIQEELNSTHWLENGLSISLWFRMHNAELDSHSVVLMTIFCKGVAQGVDYGNHIRGCIQRAFIGRNLGDQALQI